MRLDRLLSGECFKSVQHPEGVVLGRVEFEATRKEPMVHVIIDGETCVWPGDTEVEYVPAINEERADRINHHLAQVHRELGNACEDRELGVTMAADISLHVDRAKDAVNELRAGSL